MSAEMSEAMSEVLQERTEGRLRILRMNRPERKNALNGDLLGALDRSLRAAANDDSVWAIALTAAGDGFCSGLDLADQGEKVRSFAAESEQRSSGDRRGGYSHLSVLMRVECEKPIVAGINGVAVGAGVSLAMNADIRIAGPSARFHPGYSRVGSSPDLGLTWTLLRAVGYERAMRFLLEQRMVPAADALALGIVSEVVERDEDLEARVLAYGEMLASVAPLAARQTKRLLVALDKPADLAGHLDTEIALALAALSSKDGTEAIRAMMTREKPVFTGE
jgi:2-(1,2-epoxy-1,2-dihydrophenyl)acetyl-CoA isomerase